MIMPIVSYLEELYSVVLINAHLSYLLHMYNLHIVH